jgi:hypothetical protein
MIVGLCITLYMIIGIFIMGVAKVVLNDNDYWDTPMPLVFVIAWPLLILLTCIPIYHLGIKAAEALKNRF